MIRAGALLYIIAISILIAIVSSMLILVSFLKRTEFDSFLDSVRLINNARSGMTLVMASGNEGTGKTLDLFGSGLDSVQISKKEWGIFDVGTSEAFLKYKRHLDVALIGMISDRSTGFALCLTDQNNLLSLCGKTEMRGSCYLPKAGINSVELEGISPSVNMKRIFVKKGNEPHPEVSKEIPERIGRLLKMETTHADSIIELSSDMLPAYISNSFRKRTIYLHGKSLLKLDNLTAEGNIVIYSERTVRVPTNCHLTDVIIIAPEIIVESGFSGTVQLFARKSIDIGKKCRFLYPSVAAVYQSDGQAEEARIKLKEDVRFSGVVLLMYEKYDASHPTEISTSKGDTITGYILTNGAVNLHGAVKGGVLCSSFVLRTNAGIYPNHLLDVQIDQEALPAVFAGISLNASIKGTNKVMKWLF
jgi:hypothetical protein